MNSFAKKLRDESSKQPEKSTHFLEGHQCLLNISKGLQEFFDAKGDRLKFTVLLFNGCCGERLGFKLMAERCGTERKEELFKACLSFASFVVGLHFGDVTPLWCESAEAVEEAVARELSCPLVTEFICALRDLPMYG